MLPGACICAVRASCRPAYTDHFAAGPQTRLARPKTPLYPGLGWAHGPVWAGERDGMGWFVPVVHILPCAASVFPEGAPSNYHLGTSGRVFSAANTLPDGTGPGLSVSYHYVKVHFTAIWPAGRIYGTEQAEVGSGRYRIA